MTEDAKYIVVSPNTSVVIRLNERESDKLRRFLELIPLAADGWRYSRPE